MFKTNDILLNDLLEEVHDGKIQLPDFQRGWVWDDERIKGLLVSISRFFPVGAIMTMSAAGDIQFQKRPIEGVPADRNSKLESYLLDGQQRLTSLYQALLYDGPVETRDRPGGTKVIKRRYYIDIQKALDPSVDPEDTVISVPEDRVEKRNFGREIVRDLSCSELEFKAHMIPTERIMDNTQWGFNYAKHWENSSDEHPYGNAFEYFMRFQHNVLNNFTKYKLPVINLDKDTSKEAVCTVFEKVNTGGVTLSVFELLTASLAADGFRLRDDWDARRSRLRSKFGVLHGVDGSNFLQAVTLLATQQRRKQAIAGQLPPGIGCKRSDILSLTLHEYQEWANKIESGFEAAAKFLHSQSVFTQANIPYNTQLVPLAALQVELGHEMESFNANKRVEHWFWSGVFGEMYGSAVESQYARDLTEVADYVRNGIEPTLIREANFDPNRLISLRTRLSAAYKGLYALQMKSGAADWLTGESLTIANWHDQNIDIHHIFPKRWCEAEAIPRIPKELYDSIINKTPIDARTNRIIGSNAPSRYLPRLRPHNAQMTHVLETHWLNQELLEDDQFAKCFLERGEAMLELIGQAMGKPIAGGRETFMAALRSAGVVDAPQDVAPTDIEWAIEPSDDDDFDPLGDAAYVEEPVAADD